MFLSSIDVCLGFQSHASLHAHNGFLRFTSGATSADLLITGMIAESFRCTYLYTKIQALVGLGPVIETCCRLSHAVSASTVI